MLKKCKVVMLPTNKKASISLHPDNKLFLSKESIGKYGQHLYFLLDDEIKKERLRWVVDYREGMNGFIHQVSVVLDSKLCPEIIATTDSSLKISKFSHWSQDLMKVSVYKDYALPEPSQSFIEKYIEKYNKGEIITDVMIEYFYNEDDFDLPNKGLQIQEYLKVNSKDNTITIKPVKDSWSREEVIILLKKIKFDFPLHRGIQVLDNELKKWIEENL